MYYKGGTILVTIYVYLPTLAISFELLNSNPEKGPESFSDSRFRLACRQEPYTLQSLKPNPEP